MIEASWIPSTSVRYTGRLISKPGQLMHDFKVTEWAYPARMDKVVEAHTQFYYAHQIDDRVPVSIVEEQAKRSMQRAMYSDVHEAVRELETDIRRAMRAGPGYDPVVVSLQKLIQVVGL